MGNPYCPVCRKRVGFTGDEPLVEATCRECGVVFAPMYSERLAPKCDKCGKDGANLCDVCWMEEHGGVSVPGSCTTETNQTPHGRPIKGEADMAQSDPPSCPGVDAARAVQYPPDPRDERIKELENALRRAWSCCDAQKGGCLIYEDSEAQRARALGWCKDCPCEIARKALGREEVKS